MRLASTLSALVLAAPAVVAAQTGVFSDGFELGSTCRWSLAFPDDAPPGVTCGLESFGPALSFVDEGAVSSPSVPDPLTARISRPAAVPTFVSIDSDDPTSLGVAGGGVTIPPGSTDGAALLDGLQQHPGVTLTAALGGVSLQATVRIVGAGETRTLDALEPATVTIAPGAAVDFEVVLDLPAPAGGALVSLTATPGLGTHPPSVVVPENQLRATFTYAAGGSAGNDLLSATLVATHEATITIEE